MQSSTITSPSVSLLTPIGYQSGDCGYCKNADSSQRTPDSRASYYVLSKTLHPEHYQELMDRGWRRSGTLFYLPDAARSCCPHYTIRLPASEFQPARDQRQALNRWNRFILGDKYIKQASIAHPKSKEEKKRANNVFDLQETVHESEEASLKPNIEPDHRFTVTLEQDTFTEEKFALFEDYQRNVHHEKPHEISRPGFRRFLCSSPIQRSETAGKKLGSYHQCYRLDGRLIAISILDLLPHAVSGVYFIYHKDFEQWSMGKLSALREAALAGEGGYGFYYMGYYIHSCDKMRYKGSYKQQYLLDYGALSWDPLDDNLRNLLHQKKYVSMSKERQQANGSSEKAIPSDMDVGNGTALHDTPHADTNLEDEWTLPEPLAAAKSGRSILDLRMPGILSPETLHSQVELSDMKISLGPGRLNRMEDIISWDEGSELDNTSVKGIAAEFAACVGPRLAREVIIDFSR